MKKKLVIFIIAAVFIVIFLYLQNNLLGLTRLDVASKRLPGSFDGYRIAQISDLHSKSFGRDQKKLEEILERAKPDMIVITGDLADGRHYDENASLMLVQKAAEIAPVYFVTGNHEWWSGKFPELKSRLEAAGAVILRDASCRISIGGQTITLVGLDDPESTGSIYDETGTITGKLHATIPKLAGDDFKVLLSHRPEAFHLYSTYDIDLVFAGHAHGGQFRLPFVGGVYSPEQGFFPKYTSGIYREENTAMVVSRGLGNSVIPLRLFNPPEVVLVTLHTAAADEAANADEEATGADEAAVTKEEGAAAVNRNTDSDKQTTENTAPVDAEKDLINETGRTVEDRIMAPEGYERVELDAGSFGEYLRKLPLKPHGSKVLYYNGETKPSDVHEAVVDMDVGSRDLQQCADSIIRLRAEYLFGIGRFEEISFNFTNGFKAGYSKWMSGKRIKVSGNKAYWVSQGNASNDYASFRRYLDIVFAYAGTLSLSKEMTPVTVEEMKPGDVFIYGETPGHCVIVLDMAVNKASGKKKFILGQGYMPAQEFHILKNPQNGSGDPWYGDNIGDRLVTPEWTFSRDQLMRFDDR